VTESGGPDGYKPIMNDGDGCVFEDVMGGTDYLCEIGNKALRATFTVNKVWVIENSGGDFIDDDVLVTMTCKSKIYDDDAVKIDSDRWKLSDYIGNGEFLTAEVKTIDGPARCKASEKITQSGVESMDDCDWRDIPAGTSSECTFTNTVFFEGIPTLSQYGLALLALLMLGVGFVGFRRFA